MTTTTRPLRGLPLVRSPRVLLAASVGVALAVALSTLVGLIVAGRSGGLGALVGGTIALLFLAFGSSVVNAATRVAPHAAVVVALTTYALQVVLVAVAFAALSRSGAVGTTLSAGWIAGGLIVATGAWTVGQLVATSRARVPVYDIALPGVFAGAPEAGSERRGASAP